MATFKRGAEKWPRSQEGGSPHNWPESASEHRWRSQNLPLAPCAAGIVQMLGAPLLDFGPVFPTPPPLIDPQNKFPRAGPQDILNVGVVPSGTTEVQDTCGEAPHQDYG